MRELAEKLLRTAAALAGRGGAGTKRSLSKKAEERRLGIRRPQRMSQGYIRSEVMASSKPCSIRNISTSGARIDVLSDTIKTHALLDGITLYFAAERREIDCEVMWRKERSIGVRFVGPYRTPTRKYGA